MLDAKLGNFMNDINKLRDTFFFGGEGGTKNNSYFVSSRLLSNLAPTYLFSFFSLNFPLEYLGAVPRWWKYHITSSFARASPAKTSWNLGPRSPGESVSMCIKLLS